MKTVSYIMIITLAGKVLALLRDMILARQYGSGVEVSAFLTASRIPRVLFDAIFASAITSSFIPIFNRALKEKGRDKAYEFSDVFISVVGMFMVLLMSLSMIFAKEIAYFFADGFDEKTHELCINLTKNITTYNDMHRYCIFVCRYIAVYGQIFDTGIYKCCI